MTNETVTKYRPTLLDALDRGDESESEDVMVEIVKVAVENKMSREDLIDLLAEHDILPGKGFNEWIRQEYLINDS